MLEKKSANSIVPIKTSAVPIQWMTLKGLLKYAMEMSRERNLRSVKTNVTVIRSLYLSLKLKAKTLV